MRFGANPVAMAKMCALLHTGSFTREEIALHAGVTVMTVSRWLTVMRNNGLTYVSGWRRSRSFHYIGTHTWGWGMPDAKKPARLSSKDCCRRYRQRQALKNQTMSNMAKTLDVLTHVS